MQRVALYARTNVATQDPEVQLEAAREYAASRGWTVEGEYVDRCITGQVALSERPAGRLLVEGARGGRFGILLTYDLTRLYRRQGDQRSIEDLAADCGIAIATLR